MKISQFKTAIATVACVLGATLGAANPASAVVLDFSGLEGSNGDEFTELTEDNFTVTDVTGGWVEAHLFGEEVPAIYNRDDDVGTVSVVENTTGYFTFNSVDLGNANRSSSTSITYLIQGLLNGSEVFSMEGTIGSQAAFTTIFSADSTAVLDNLLITIDGTDTSSYNIDNINVDTVDVPEPATLLGLAAVAGFGLATRKKRNVAAV